MADGLSVDTSSYPRPVAVAPTNPLDTLGKITAIQQGQQNLQSGAIGIDKQKLDLINQRFETMTKDFTGLMANPDLNEDKIRKRIETDVKLGIVTPDMAGTFISQLPPTQGLKAPEAAGVLKQHLGTWLGHAQTIKEALDTQLGAPSTIDTGNAIQPVSVSPLNGIRSTGLPIAKGLPPTTGGFDQNGQPAFAPAPPNAIQAPPAAPGVNIPLPMTRPAQAPVVAPIEPQTPNQAVAQRFAPAPPPLFEEGKKAYTEDQGQALARATAMKPAEQALKLLPGLRSGPTTEAFTKAVAALKANGIVDINEKDDPTVIRQIVNKKLAQYVQGSPVGQRSDAAQALTEASSPNANTQLNPALVKLTRDALALDRVQVARPNAFEGQDYQNYGKHRATFPQSIDERAFGLGDLPKEESQKLVDKMHNLYKKNPNSPEALKFFKSLDIAKKQGLLNSQSDEE